jgi:hypothetical protein
MKHMHHIIPKHAGGTDDPANLVELSIDEHAEAHRRLYEEFGRWQDKIAWLGLAGLITHEERLEEMYAARRGVPTGPMSEEQKARISKTLKGRKLGPQSPEHIAKRTATCKGRPNPMKGKTKGPMSLESKEKLSKSKKGVKLSPATEERKSKISESKKGRKRHYLPDGSFIMINP